MSMVVLCLQCCALEAFCHFLSRRTFCIDGVRLTFFKREGISVWYEIKKILQLYELVTGDVRIDFRFERRIPTAYALRARAEYTD